MTDTLKLLDCNILVDAIIEVKRMRYVQRLVNKKTNTNTPLPDTLSALWASKDLRMQDLAATIEDGSLVTTGNILRMVLTKLVKQKGFSHEDASSLLEQIKNHPEVKIVPGLDDWSKIKQYALTQTKTLMETYSPQHLAIMDVHGRALTPEETAYTTNPVPEWNTELVDGEDLGVLFSVKAAQSQYKQPVMLVTADKHCGYAASKITDVKKAILYVNPQGGGWREQKLCDGQAAKTIKLTAQNAQKSKTINPNHVQSR